MSEAFRGGEIAIFVVFVFGSAREGHQDAGRRLVRMVERCLEMRGFARSQPSGGGSMILNWVSLSAGSRSATRSRGTSRTVLPLLMISPSMTKPSTVRLGASSRLPGGCAPGYGPSGRIYDLKEAIGAAISGWESGMLVLNRFSRASLHRSSCLCGLGSRRWSRADRHLVPFCLRTPTRR